MIGQTREQIIRTHSTVATVFTNRLASHWGRRRNVVALFNHTYNSV